MVTTKHEGHEVFYSIPEKTLWLSVSSVVKIIYLFRHPHNEKAGIIFCYRLN